MSTRSAPSASAALPIEAVGLAALVALLAFTPLDFYATHWPRAARGMLVVLIALFLAGWSITAGRRTGTSERG